MREMTSGTLRRQRVAAVTAVLLGVLWGFLASAADRGTPALLALFPLLLLLGYHGYWLFRSPSRAGLRVSPSGAAIYAPPRGAVTPPVVMIAWLPFQLISYGRRWERDVFWWLSLAASLAVIAWVVVHRWRRVPLLEVTPEGIGLGRPRRAVFVPWAALDRDGPLWATRNDGFLRLPLARPELVRRRFGRRAEQRLWIQDLDVAPGVPGRGAAPLRAASGTPRGDRHPAGVRPAVPRARGWRLRNGVRVGGCAPLSRSSPTPP
ncbi:hypothetical protein NCC78_05860 [Micromonospora phytophila]|uniref:hypothetical protein n=1 Tax=Micromonospora phytophila TaxID=709888 RepID=UPI00202DF2F4|nr:hypothetical protein [Micromonospora phytophila]MCM0674214.1 hypothetical protein [Micromonospora phytophila]